MTEKRILCFAHGRDGDWEAICLDFDIAVQGRSFDDVRAALEQGVESYIEDALKEDKSTARQLLQRAAPWYVRLRYLTQFFIGTLLRRDNEYHHAFDMPCAA